MRCDQNYYSLGSRLNARMPNPFRGLIPAPSPLAGDTITVAQLLAPYPQFTAVSLQRNTGGESYVSFSSVFRKQAIQRRAHVPARLYMVEAAREAAIY